MRRGILAGHHGRGGFSLARGARDFAASVTLAAALLAPLAGFAHGPWPYECCHDRDCAEVDARHVVEAGDEIIITLPAGAHPMAPGGGRWTTTRDRLRKPVTGEWGVCLSPTGALLCVFPPAVGG